RRLRRVAFAARGGGARGGHRFTRSGGRGGGHRRGRRLVGRLGRLIAAAAAQGYERNERGRGEEEHLSRFHEPRGSNVSATRIGVARADPRALMSDRATLAKG